MAEVQVAKFYPKNLGKHMTSDEEGCRAFFRSLTATYGLIWHPDTDFAEYVDLNTGQRVFSDSAADDMDVHMAQCFEVLGSERVYDVALEVWNDWQKENEENGSNQGE
jgi:hypothetical protein